MAQVQGSPVVNKAVQPGPAAIIGAPAPTQPSVRGLLKPKAVTLNITTLTPPATSPNPTMGPVANGTSENGDQSDMANTKEKTPMCLINELARFNKLTHTYALTDEQGPAHKKTFFVKLNLGDEQYAAQGPSIKKAQHAAASIALVNTKHPRPVPRSRKKEPTLQMTNQSLFGVRSRAEPIQPPTLHRANNSAVAYVEEGKAMYPTVELNALAMKRGEPAIYQSIEQARPPQYYPPNLNFRGMYNQRYHYPGPRDRTTYMSLKVGQREFIGEGETRKAARHSAACKALRILRNLPLPSYSDGNIVIPTVGDKVPIAHPADGSAASEELKSEISLVYEIAGRRELPVTFEVTRESGPPHLRSFITSCKVGEFSTEAEGNSKRLSKKRAAELMLEQLKLLPILPVSALKVKAKPPQNKKKNRNLIKVQKGCPDYGNGINPISRLIQIQQAKKEKEPVYSLLVEKGLPRRREFVIQVTVGTSVVTGTGPNKRLAKRSAAEAMLSLLGYSKPMPQPTKPAIKLGPAEQNGGDKRVKFSDQDAGAGDGHGHKQIVPGILIMKDGMQHNTLSSHTAFRPVRGSVSNTAVTIAKELLDTGLSPTAEAFAKSGATGCGSHSVVSPKQQLLYLAEVMGFKVQFTDFPKGNTKNDFLSLVSLSTNPPQVSHGAGATLEASHDMAALTVLKALSEMGLEPALKPMKPEGDSLASGDGLHLKPEPEKPANSAELVSNDVNSTVAVKAET